MTESAINRERRRAEVYRLLKDGVDDKMLINRSRPARDLLSRAYKLAKEPTPIFSPLFEVAAYRLANVLFRSARSEVDLLEVNRLYIETSADAIHRLGPMPLIHRIAVLHRLASLRLPGDAERDRLWGEMEAVYKDACSLARHKNYGVSYAGIGGANIQGSLHNLLELAAYFADLDYDERVSGLVSPYEDLALGDEWTIVGTGGIAESVRWTKELAAIEMQERAEEGADLMFELGSPRPRAKWKVWTPDGRNGSSGGRALLMLARLCRGPSSDEQLFSAAYGDAEFNEVDLRDAKRELRALLSRFLKDDGKDLLPVVETGQPLKLKAELRIIGMVSIDSLRVDR